MATRIISIVNQKGGVSKTTTCVNVGAALAKQGKYVLLVDMDPQGNLSSSVGIEDLDNSESTVYELLTTKADIADLIRDNVNGLYDVLPSDIRLSAADPVLANHLNKHSILNNKLQAIADSYDYILIDCPPSLGVLTFNALTASTEYIVPLQAEYLALKGVALLQDTIESVKEHLNARLTLCGVVLTMYDQRTILAQEVYANATQYFENKVFNTRIRKNIALAEAPANGQDIFNYRPDSNGAKDYMNLSKEIILQED